MPTELWSQFDAAPLALTLRVAAVATGLALLLGVALGWVFARTRLPGRALLEAVCMLPLVLPPTVLGYGILGNDINVVIPATRKNCRRTRDFGLANAFTRSTRGSLHDQVRPVRPP